MSRQREKAPKYESDAARPKKVTLPPGWTPSSKKEAEAYLKNLNYDELTEVMKLHFYAFFSGGTFSWLGKDETIKLFRDNGLVVGPWHKHGFPGMCNSEALGKQRFANSWRESNEQRSSDATFDRLERLGLSKDEQAKFSDPEVVKAMTDPKVQMVINQLRMGVPLDMHDAGSKYGAFEP